MGCNVHIRVARGDCHGFSSAVRYGLSLSGAKVYDWCLGSD